MDLIAHRSADVSATDAAIRPGSTSVGTRHPRWPLLVIGLGLSTSALWSAFVCYGIYGVVTRFLE